MGIRIEQPGGTKAAATAGTIIGKGKRAEEDRARAEREQARAQQIAAQREARKAAMKWEQEKMAMRSQQEFQQELAAKQWDYEKFNRAKSWEIEKAEMASRMDFERQEKERTQKMDEAEIALKSITKQIESGMITGDEPYIQERKQYYTDRAAGVTDTPTSMYTIPAPKVERPPSATRQKGEIEASFELEGYTPDDLIELGLDPADFPGVGGSIEQSVFNKPTAESLRSLGTREAYEKGIQLGYWK